MDIIGALLAADKAADFADKAADAASKLADAKTKRADAFAKGINALNDTADRFVDRSEKKKNGKVNRAEQQMNGEVNRAEQIKNGAFEREQGALDRELERSETIKSNKVQRGISVASTTIDSLMTLSNIGSNISDIVNSQRNSKASTAKIFAEIQRDNERLQSEIQKNLAEAKKLENDSKTAMLDVQKKHENIADNQNKMHQQRMKELSEGHEERMTKIIRDSEDERERILNERERIRNEREKIIRDSEDNRKHIEFIERMCQQYMDSIRQLILSDIDSNTLAALMNLNSQLTTVMLGCRRSLALPYSDDNGDYQ